MHTHTIRHLDHQPGSWSRFAARCLVTIAVLAAGVAAAPSPTSADTGGCGAAWTLVDLAGLKAFIRAANPALNDVRGVAFDEAVKSIFEAADRNDDEGVCARTNKGNQGQDQFYVDPEWQHLLVGHYVITNVNDNNSRPL